MLQTIPNIFGKATQQIKQGLQGPFDISSLNLRPIDSQAQLAWETQWTPHCQNPERALDGYPISKNGRKMFYWFEQEQSKNPDSFDVSIWHNDFLCGLARGNKDIYDNNFSGYLRSVEGAPFQHPLKQLIHPISIASAVTHCQEKSLSLLIADAPFSHGNMHDTYRRFNFAANPESNGIAKNVMYYARQIDETPIDWSQLKFQGPKNLSLTSGLRL